MSVRRTLATVLALLSIVSMIVGCAGSPLQLLLPQRPLLPAAPAAPAATASACCRCDGGACSAPAAAAPGDAGAWRRESRQEIKIGVSMLFDDLWLTTLRDAMTEYAKSLSPNVELVMVDSKEDMATQLGPGRELRHAEGRCHRARAGQHRCHRSDDQSRPDAGIPLVYVNRFPSNLPEGVAYVGSDSIQAGIMQTEWLAEKLGGKGNVVIMNGNLAQEAAQKRTEGVKQVSAKFPDIKITKKTPATGTAPRAWP